MQKAPPTPKGFRDIHPGLAKKRREVISQITTVLEKAGFDPIETPTIEFAQTLKGKYGEEERLIYEFSDRGGRDLALRYDLTVPLARYVATYNPKLPFRRYQIGQVFRGENPQASRWREFTQLDFDTIGLSEGTNNTSIEEDALIVATTIEAIRTVGLKNARMAINDRRHFGGIPIEVIRAWDKYHKIGEEGVEKEILGQGFTKNEFNNFKYMLTEGKRTPDLNKLFNNLKDKHGLRENEHYYFDPFLARGLDYYTSSIFELKPDDNSKSLSIGAGGRYDNLIDMFVHPATKGNTSKQIPAVGFSFGIDRLIESLP